ncbi:transcriptional regulator with XRE-family HTH domain [Thermocatellispora tengchongensis]|uniref:Transcriptional regulator with XRE-family HTH domain n=1 Tax=Thermocatellispora tengchongensis TaxID=1073253 RepID=A0A840PEX4_9ACTN|nr:helix-turn-helix transcriptional regulator [Thermocatellispora tengchongensis]MBB5137529.1 transcriptional regulator with XRE-family HTH domain [Thermocatellispora tengchongensis]
MKGTGAAPGKRQRLATELRRLRDLAGISGRDLATRIGISQSKVSRIESGTVIPTMPEVTAWAEAVEASPETRAWLSEMTESAFTEVHTWRAELQRQAHLQDDIREQEDQARLVRVFQPTLIPGLLQTAEYARRVFALFDPPYSDGDLAMALAARLQRQLALYQESRRFEFLITEAALRCRPGPPRLLLAQLDRVASVSTLENVTIGLIPHNREAVVFPSHGFTIYDTDIGDDAAEGTFVEIETTHVRLTAHDAEDVAIYTRQWSLLSGTAIYDDEAREFLSALAADVRALDR